MWVNIWLLITVFKRIIRIDYICTGLLAVYKWGRLWNVFASILDYPHWICIHSTLHALYCESSIQQRHRCTRVLWICGSGFKWWCNCAVPLWSSLPFLVHDYTQSTHKLSMAHLLDCTHLRNIQVVGIAEGACTLSTAASIIHKRRTAIQTTAKASAAAAAKGQICALI